MAERDVFDPRWSQNVLDEMRRNRPEGVTEQKIDRRIGAMNASFPRAMTSGYEPLTSGMYADPKDRHVLAATVHSRSDVLVTDNVKDFDPPSTGPYAMRVERLSHFLSRKLDERPDRMVSALQAMVDRNRHDPRTMPALIDKMATQPELRGFAQKLNAVVSSTQGDSRDVLASTQRAARSASQATVSAALDGVAPAGDAVTTQPRHDPQAHRPAPTRPSPDRGQER